MKRFVRMAGAAFLGLLLVMSLGCPNGDSDSGVIDSGDPATDSGPGTDSGNQGIDSGATDAGSTGTVAGDVTSTAACPAATADDDCMGTLYVAVFDAADPSTATMLAAVSVAASDLSGGGPVAFSIPDVPEGGWFLAAFLDDNDNAVVMMPLPDTGDPATDPSIAVTVTAGAQTDQDAVLSARVQ